jgi:hypothetical protein
VLRKALARVAARPWLLAAVDRIYHPGAPASALALAGRAELGAVFRIIGGQFHAALNPLNLEDAELCRGACIVGIERIPSADHSARQAVYRFAALRADNMQPGPSKRDRPFVLGTAVESRFYSDPWDVVLCQEKPDFEGLERARDQIWAEALLGLPRWASACRDHRSAEGGRAEVGGGGMDLAPALSSIPAKRLPLMCFACSASRTGWKNEGFCGIKASGQGRTGVGGAQKTTISMGSGRSGQELQNTFKKRYNYGRRLSLFFHVYFVHPVCPVQKGD